jgi:hypothetical protein
MLALSRGTAAAADDLYRARTIVTGQGEEGRSAGFAECLGQVLVKVSGDPRLLGDPGVAAMVDRALRLSPTSATATAWQGFRSATSRVRAIGPTI